MIEPSTIYVIATGEVVKTVWSSNPGGQIQIGQAYIQGDYRSDEFMVSNGVPVEIPARPSEYHAFDYAAKSWLDRRDNSFYANEAIRKRAKLLQASDWTQLPDVPLATKEAWATYRQALRDITEQPGYPLEVVWPVAP